LAAALHINKGIMRPAIAKGCTPLAYMLIIHVNVSLTTNHKRHFRPWRNRTNAHNPRK